MNIEQKKKMLFLDYKLDPETDFYVVDDQIGKKILLRKTGIDKLERQLRINFEIIQILQTPFDKAVQVTIYGRATTPDGEIAKLVVCTNPINCAYPNYAEVAEKRCRHRLLIKIARLDEHDVFSEIESDKWTETRNLYKGAVEEVTRLLNVNNGKTNKKESGTSKVGSKNGTATVPGEREAVGS